MAAICTALLVGTAYQLLASAFRIFKKFELQKGELVRLDVRSLVCYVAFQSRVTAFALRQVRFDDFLKALPKAIENEDNDDDALDEEEFSPNGAVL